ncbi:MAG TPA: 30S ribosomal protein S14 [Candidatus Lokiarchaeia archaeon]|nr:30S ribosomal protein S14 [Candidatus Lokiarchaeia archaeon]
MNENMVKKTGILNGVRCRRCNTNRGVIRKYGLDICRRCIREVAEDLHFHKYH